MDEQESEDSTDENLILYYKITLKLPLSFI